MNGSVSGSVSRAPASSRLGPVAFLFIGVARLWQLTFSAILPPSCRFSPSCSAYAIEAIRTHGAARGGWLALRRISRCHPWGGMGHDPVPPPRERSTP
ncbi:membrane protein insertion efficiency factor YidD [Thermaurantiacus sp.]